MKMKDKISALQVAIPDLPKKVVRIATWVMVLSGIALSGSLEFEGETIAWDFPSKVEYILKWVFFLSLVLSGGDAGTKSKGKKEK